MIASEGYMGLAPMTTKPGDIVCILFGGQVSYVLRQREDGTYFFVGECYIRGITWNHGWRDPRRGTCLISFVGRETCESQGHRDGRVEFR